MRIWKPRCVRPSCETPTSTICAFSHWATGTWERIAHCPYILLCPTWLVTNTVFYSWHKAVPNKHYTICGNDVLRVGGDFCCRKISRTSSTHLALFFSHSAYTFNFYCARVVPERADSRYWMIILYIIYDIMMMTLFAILRNLIRDALIYFHYYYVTSNNRE